MKQIQLSAMAVLISLCALLAGCAHKSLNPEDLKTINRPAVFVRALSDPILKLSPADADQEKRLRARINAFQMNERLRSAIIHHLPQVQPWTDIMPSIEVSTLLDTLLVQDKAEAPRYELLMEHGSNTVLEILVEESGLHYNPKTQKTGFFLKGSARLFHIRGSTLWKSPFSLDSTEIPSFPGLIPKELSHDGYFDSLNDFLFRLTESSIRELAGDLPTESTYVARETPLSEAPSSQAPDRAASSDNDGDGDDNPPEDE